MKDKVLETFKKHKILFIVLIVILLIIIFSLFTDNNSNDKWEDLKISEHLPTPEKGKLDTGSDLDDYLSLTIKGIKKDYYNEYKEDCIKMGYVIEKKDSNNRYEAFNDEGYELSLSFVNNNLSIILQAPENLSEISWPTSGIASLLPTPKSNLGKIIIDSSNSFKIEIGNTSKEEFNNYVKDCQNKGFNIDYSNKEDYYYAKNNEGYTININYIGNNRIEIMIEQKEPESNTTETIPSNELRKEFKDAMDSYENFMDEYVAFMKKYQASNGTDISLISEYSEILNKYNQFVKDFENWKNKDLNEKEEAYYLEVLTRVNKKLLEVTN